MFDPMTMQWLLQTLGPDGAAQTLAGAGIEPPPLPVDAAMSDMSMEAGGSDYGLGTALTQQDTFANRFPQDLGSGDRSMGGPPPVVPQNVPLPIPRPPGLGESLDASAPAAPMVTPGIPPPLAAKPIVPPAVAEKPPENALLAALRGVSVPKPPEPVKPSSPAAPRPSAAIKPGDLLNMILMLNQGGGAQAKAPPTLGAALSGRG